MNDNDAGYLNDPAQAQEVKTKKHTARRCRWCRAPLKVLPQGGVVCSGTCDLPIVNAEFTRQVITGVE